MEFRWRKDRSSGGMNKTEHQRSYLLVSTERKIRSFKGGTQKTQIKLGKGTQKGLI